MKLYVGVLTLNDSFSIFGNIFLSLFKEFKSNIKLLYWELFWFDLFIEQLEFCSVVLRFFNPWFKNNDECSLEEFFFCLVNNMV